MHFTQPTVSDPLKSIQIVGDKTIELEYTSGRLWTVNSIIWSTTKNRKDSEYPEGGYVNFSQLGSVSGAGVYGTKVNKDNPLTIDGTEYTTSAELTTFLISNLS